jgi:hypothetical protein
VGYLEVARPPQVLSLVLDHPLAGEVQKLPPYQQALQTPQYEQFAAAIKRLEEQLGMPWRQAAGTLTSGGLYFGFDLPSQGVIALARADGDAQAEQAQAAALDLARSIAAARGQPDPVKQDEHRGVMVYEIGPVSFATCGPWLIAANKRQRRLGAGRRRSVSGGAEVAAQSINRLAVRRSARAAPGRRISEGAQQEKR